MRNADWGVAEGLVGDWRSNSAKLAESLFGNYERACFRAKDRMARRECFRTGPGEYPWWVFD